ncbi:MAG: hypothetical protein M3T56_11600 [Chloroflexota bacterium]|nr:hypothetical protein [Chloroflexota bacterium]
MAIVIVAAAVAVAGGVYAWSELVPGPPMTIAIVPADEVTLAPTAQFQFVADVRDARNRVVGTKPTWTSEASIDQRGLFTAPDRATVYYVQAAIGELAATAKITVKPGEPRTLRVLPPAASLKPRDTVAFSATAFDEWGNNVPWTPTWRVTVGGGAIDEQGIFAAGASGVSTITADVNGITTSATATAQCVPPRTETAAGLTFTVVCGTSADVWLNGNRLDAATVTTTIDRAVVAVEAAFDRSLRHRLNVTVFATKAGFDIGLKQLLHVEPTPLEEGVFIPPAIVAIDWSGADEPEAIARHEITHLFIDEAAGRRVAVPYWLHEGLATLNEFPVSAETALISRYCTASAAKAGQMPALATIATGPAWRAYVNEVGVIAYYLAAQVGSFVVSDSGNESKLLDKIGGGLPIESAYTAASGRSFDSFTAELNDRALALSQTYPGVATTTRASDGATFYVLYGQPPDVRVNVNISNARFGGSNSPTTSRYGCSMGFLGNNWPRGTYVVTVNGPAGRVTANLVH